MSINIAIEYISLAERRTKAIENIKYYKSIIDESLPMTAQVIRHAIKLETKWLEVK